MPFYMNCSLGKNTDKKNDVYQEYLPPAGSYFMTQTLKPAYYALCARRQLKETKSHFKHILKRYSDNFYYTVELTKSANIHYHAWLLMRDDSTLSRLCILDDLKILGNCRLEAIKAGTEQNIYNYLNKDLELTDKALNYTKKGKLRSPLYDIECRYYSQNYNINLVNRQIIKEFNEGWPDPLDFDEEFIYSQTNQQLK